MLKCGDAVEMPKPGQAVPHLWIIVTDPLPSSHEVVIVNVTSLRQHSDTTVVLKPGDHPYIRHDSVIFYADARLADVRNIQAGIDKGWFQECAACSPALLKRIREGLLASKFTRNKIKDFCRARWQSPGSGPAAPPMSV
jgi:hypothetical protein